MKFITQTMLTLLLIFVSALGVNANDGTADIKVGYISTDETGNGSVNQETFNINDGFAFSITNLLYQTTNGVKFSANLTNANLENRNLRFNSSKSGLFSISAYNNKYRRNYNYDKTINTTRDSYGFQSSIIASQHIRFFGGYAMTDKEGSSLTNIDFMNDTSLFITDYRHTSYNLGVQGFHELGNLRVAYQNSNFEDKTTLALDRESKQLTISGFAKIPKLKDVYLSGGYIYRTDTETKFDTELKTNQLWSGVKYHFLKNHTLEYRFKFARTDNSSQLVETDNWVNSITLGKKWKKSGGLRVGFENRIVDDLVNRSETNMLIVDGWYKLGTNLLFRGKASTRSKDIPTGSTLLGDESITRHLFSVRYTDKTYGNLTLRIDTRIRKNNDEGVNTQIDYTSLSSILNLKNKPYGSLNITYSYYIGEFENRDFITGSNKSYEFSDHVVSGTINPNSYKNFDFSFGGTYYRSRRNHDKEKFSLNFIAKYSLPKEHLIELKYDIFNYDDYMLNRNYYTGNIVEINIIKGIKF